MTRKDAILKAATELFVEKGYDATSTSEIAERAKVAHGTIFHHFGKKENLLLQLAETTISEFSRSIDALDLNVLSGLEALKATLRAGFKLMELHWDNIYVLMQEMPHIIGGKACTDHPEFITKHLMDILAQRQSLIERGIVDGSIRVCDAGKMVYLTEALFAGVIHTRMKNILTTPQNIVDETLDFIDRALKA